jgi:hypothetical protein
VTNNRWFEVYITDGLDNYYEKSTIPRIYIQTLKVRGEPLSTSEIDIYTVPHTLNEICYIDICLTIPICITVTIKSWRSTKMSIKNI